MQRKYSLIQMLIFFIFSEISKFEELTLFFDKSMRDTLYIDSGHVFWGDVIFVKKGFFVVFSYCVIQ
jgi:hypothetical protein